MPKPGPPPAGFILVSRVPRSRTLKLTYPSNETKFFIHTPNIFLELEQAGIPKEKLTKVMDYVWNFYNVMVVEMSKTRVP